MLEIIVPETELFDNRTYTFIYIKEQKLKLEHSLVSISKWEMKWHKSYFLHKEKTAEEFCDYIKCMTLTQNVNPNLYLGLTTGNLNEIVNYINDPMTAATFSDKHESDPYHFLTSDIIYYWMFSYGIPEQCAKWHFNRLMALIKVFSDKNSTEESKKRTTEEIMEENRRKNAEMRAKFNSKG